MNSEVRKEEWIRLQRWASVGGRVLCTFCVLLFFEVRATSDICFLFI